ncbi:MAG TPA: hypothetical protein VIL18_11815 [Longimicrobiales bacterium]
MSEPTSRPRDVEPQAYLAQRRARLERLLQRPLTVPAARALPPERRRFLREEAEELYWNELAWEKLTGNDPRARDGMAEFAFPGFLAFIDGLLANSDGAAGSATPRPEVVEDVLVFLAERCIAPPDPEEDDEESEAARHLTARLLDLVLYRLYRLPVDDVERLELARLRGDE